MGKQADQSGDWSSSPSERLQWLRLGWCGTDEKWPNSGYILQYFPYIDYCDMSFQNMDKGDEGKGTIKNNPKGFVCIYLFA